MSINKELVKYIVIFHELEIYALAWKGVQCQLAKSHEIVFLRKIYSRKFPQ